MSNWNDIEIKSNSVFLKIDSSSPQQVRIIGNPIEKMVHGFGKEETDCSGENCMKCQGGSELKQRFKVNVYNWSISRVQIWEFGPAIAKQLKEINRSLSTEGKTFDDMDLKISSTGERMQKKYLIMPWPSTKPLPQLVLHDLNKKSEIPF